jgi:hypothetical protein
MGWNGGSEPIRLKGNFFRLITRYSDRLKFPEQRMIACSVQAGTFDNVRADEKG